MYETLTIADLTLRQSSRAGWVNKYKFSDEVIAMEQEAPLSTVIPDSSDNQTASTIEQDQPFVFPFFPEESGPAMDERMSVSATTFFMR